MTRRGEYGDSDDDETSSAGSSQDGARGASRTQLALQDKDDVLVERAMHRIQRARAKGKSDVKLDKDELAALERRKKQMQEEERRRRKGSGSGSDKKKRKDNRIAVPLSQLEPISRKKKSKQSPRKESVPRRHEAKEAPESQERQVYPPMGYFPPPVSTRHRPRSGTSLSHRPPSRTHDERGSSPFNYEYIQRPHSANRHVSDSAGRYPGARGYPLDDPWAPNVSPGSSSGSGGPSARDPFQFQTAGPRAPYQTGAAAASRYAPGPPELGYPPRRGVPAPAAARSRHEFRHSSSDDETSDASTRTSESESTSDDHGNGAQIREPARGRAAEIVVEVSPEREPVPAKKKSSASSPVKRKPVQSRGGGRRRRK